jgi:hypothetical protein
VRNLVKVAKECKHAHTRAIEKPKAFPQPKVVSGSQEESKGHLLGKSFAEAIRKRLRKKLPLHRDFEFIRRSEVSPMGIVSHDSLHDSLRDSVSSTHSEVSPSSSPERGPIRRWQIKTLQRTFDSSSRCRRCPLSFRTY